MREKQRPGEGGPDPSARKRGGIVELLLIQPAISGKEDFLESSHSALQPLAPAMLAALTPDEVTVRFVDDRLETISFDDPPDLVGITTSTYTAKRTYEIADRFLERGSSVVLGGHHVKMEPDETLRHATSIVIGEAEGLWGRVISDFREGNMKERYQLEEMPDLETIPNPDRTIFQDKDYLPVEMVETTRGCPNDCSFCSVSAFFGRGYRHRPINDVVEEVEGLEGNLVFFVDDNIVGDFDYAKRLFKELRSLNIKWFGQASINMAHDEELLSLMRKSGCVGNLIGFESISDENLKSINKLWNKNISYDEAVDRIHGKGLSIYASFITGLDGDTRSTLEKTYEFAMRKKFLAANFNVLTPYPGTKLYHELKDSGRLRDERWWLSGDLFRVRFVPENFEPGELRSESVRIKRKFYSYPNILKRFSNWRPNFSSPYHLLIYLIMNKTLHDEQTQLRNKLAELYGE